MHCSHLCVGLLSLLLGISSAAQKADWERAWPNSNKDFGFDDQIYSDEEGSADYTYGNNNKGNYGDNYDWRGGSYDDEDSYEDYSGDYKFREVDDYDSSGDGTKAIYPPIDLTPCQEDFMDAQQASRKGRPLDHLPQCTQTGQYKAEQCSTSGQCWCVNNYGEEIPDTRRIDGRRIRCIGHDRTIRVNDRDDIDIDGDIETPIVKDTNPGVGTGIDNTGSKSKEDTDDEESPFVPATQPTHRAAFLSQPLILAGIIAFAVVCLLCAVLLVMFIVYRMRKKDEGSYALDEPKRSPAHPYQRAPTKEYFA